MIICALCDAEAPFAIDGVPICQECLNSPKSDIEAPSTDREVSADLHREILESTARAHAASKELIAIMGDIPSGLPHPDGSLRIQNAARALADARNEVMAAHARLDEFLARIGVHRNLKPPRGG